MVREFSERLLKWFDANGRKDLPWQQYDDPYRIWLSEIMLQQTQVQTVIPYFERFCQQFPSVQDLAAAPEDEVLHLWSGLGYYARARNLHAAAKQVVAEFDGEFPREQTELESLKGIGRSTAAAIRAQAFGEKAAILDGNVKRVLARLYAIDGWPGATQIERQMWNASDSLLPEERLRDYTQAIMDLGATLCTRSNPDCERCPFTKDCGAYLEGRVSELPKRKPKKKIPTKEIVFLIQRNTEDEVLLEKRPPTGIWGGLWSFPEVDHQDLSDRLNEFGLAAKDVETLETGEHVFSHFRLKYTPVVFPSIANKASQIAESDRHIWYSGDRSKALGLAAPVAKLIDRLQHHL